MFIRRSTDSGPKTPPGSLPHIADVGELRSWVEEISVPRHFHWDFLGLLANGNSVRLLEKILAHARGALPDFPVLGLEVRVGLERFLPVLRRSDHVPFWEKGIPAVMWTDTSEFRNPHYHQPSDTPDTLDYDFPRHVAQLLAHTVLGA